MVPELTEKKQREMHQIADVISSIHGHDLEDVVRHGKLTTDLMKVRREIIRTIHATSRYTRPEIAQFFGLSIYTITSSLESEAKAKHNPFTEAEDEIIRELHCQGCSMEQLCQELPDRSSASIRRRISIILECAAPLGPFPRPSYKGDITQEMIRMAQRENAEMRKRL